MERAVAPENLRAAYGRVMRNKGAPGVAGMAVEGLAAHLRAEWPAVRGRLLAGTYRSALVRRHELPKPGGGTRVLGIPTVLDRFIQQRRYVTCRQVETGRKLSGRRECHLSGDWLLIYKLEESALILSEPDRMPSCLKHEPNVSGGIQPGLQLFESG